MHAEYRSIMAALDEDPAVRCVVVTGTGCRVLRRRRHVQPWPSTPTTAATTRAYPTRWRRPATASAPSCDHDFAWHFGLRLPVIAAVNGACAGVGLALACYCDLRFGANGAKITTAAPKLGLPAEYGLSWVLPRLVGPAHAADLLLSGRIVTAEEAAAMGLFTGAVDGRRAGATRAALRHNLATTVSPTAVATTKRQLWSDLSSLDVGESVEDVQAPAERDDGRAGLPRGRGCPPRATAAAVPMTDLDWAAVQRHAAVGAGPRRHPCGARTSTLSAPAARPEVPRDSWPRRARPPGLRAVRVTSRLLAALAPWYVRKRPAASTPRTRAGPTSRGGCAGPPRSSDPPTSSSARSSPPARACSPRSSSREFKLLPRPGGGETFDTVRAGRRGRPRRPLEDDLRMVRPRARSRRRRSPRSTPPACAPARPWSSRCSGRRCSELVRADLRAMAWLAPHLVGRIPVAALANPPALVELFAETITEELDFRLEADNMLDIAAVLADLGQRGYVVPRPHPDARDPPGARDGAPRRLRLRRRRPACGRRHRHRRPSCAPG